MYISKFGLKNFDQVTKYFKTVVIKYPFKNKDEGAFWYGFIHVVRWLSQLAVHTFTSDCLCTQVSMMFSNVSEARIRGIWWHLARNSMYSTHFHILWILVSHLYTVNWVEKKRYILRTASTYHMYENIFYKIYSLRIYRKIYRICREWKCILVLYTQLSWNLKKIDISNINNSNYSIAYISKLIAHMSNAIDHWVWDTWVWLYPFKKSTWYMSM